MEALLLSKRIPRSFPLVLFVVLTASSAVRVAAAEEFDPVGLWYAQLSPTESHPVEFQIRIARNGRALAAALINGAASEPFSGASWDGTTLTLSLAHYDAKIVATRKGDGLEGTYERVAATGLVEISFAASRTVPPAPKVKKPGVSVGGTWAVEIAEPAGVTKGAGLFRQKGTTVTGTVATASGDYGPLHGTFDGEQLVLMVFNGFFVYRFDGELLPDGSLAGEFRSRKNPPSDWKAGRLSERISPEGPSAFEGVKPRNPDSPFVFSLPDAEGKTVSSDDPRFRGKPVVVAFMGTWCPNCHDEAPVLRDLHSRYRAQGLEVVALTWEYTDDADRSGRLVRQFAERHRVTYPILFAGTTKGAATSGPRTQLDGFSGYPTTLFLDRSHRIVRVHSGFDGPATGVRFKALRKEMDETVRKLLGLGVGEFVVPDATSLTLK
jgi:thiol-disulfide isomerase/thioredoxin